MMEKKIYKNEKSREWSMQQEKVASMKRRCDYRDYTDRGIYMITIAIEGRKPLLGALTGKAEVTEGTERPGVQLSPLGEKVKECWMAIPQYYPKIEVIKLCVMPDHIHGVLFVTERMEKHLGHVINGFKAGTRKAARELGVITAAMPQYTGQTKEGQAKEEQAKEGQAKEGQAKEGQAKEGQAKEEQAKEGQAKEGKAKGGQASDSVLYTGVSPQSKQSHHSSEGMLWEPGYNDRILFHKGQFQRMLNYLDDNPRRLLLKRSHPEYFSQLGTITVVGIPMQAMGNRFLLDNPMKLQVQCSRHLYPAEIEQMKAKIIAQAHDQGIILVSPCISPGEQAIATAALAEGIPLIVLLLNGFPEHFKPQPRYLDACTEGRLLMLAPYPHQNEKIAHMRARCLELNKMAACICEESTF